MKIRRIFSCLLALMMLITVAAGLPFAVTAADDGSTTLIAASDFQPKNGNESGVPTIKKILQSMAGAGVSQADGFLFCGDFDFGTIGNAEETAEGLAILKDTMKDTVAEENMVFVQGNHDVGGTAGLSPSGNNDPASGKYGVFVINNDDYMWYNKDEVRIKRTAQYLINYLNEKLESGFDKPIFVMSHLPLHYSMRTIQDGDATYASYIFNALNEAGQKGLNIIFLFGHNHSNGWDDYLGGSNIYLAKGDEIQIAKNNKNEFESHKLNFTYMNAGYIGYYDVNNTGVRGDLSMSLIRITSAGVVIIGRYTAEGMTVLKAEGIRNDYKQETAYDPNTTVYDKYQTILPTKVTDKTPIAELVSLPVRGRQYVRVNNVNQLKDGGKYLMVYNSDPDQLLKPEIVEKSNSAGTRVGMELINVYGFGEQTVYGKYNDLEWTFTKVGDYWMVGKDGKNLKITKTDDKAVTVTLEDRGSPLIISGTNVYTFSFGDYVFNYNARGLMNAYTSDPAYIYIYEYVGYTIKVTDGSASVDGEQIKTCDSGKEVTLTANAPAEGMRFDKWVVENGKLEGVDLTKETLTFTMPENALDLKAEYVEIGTEDENDQSDDQNDDQNTTDKDSVTEETPSDSDVGGNQPSENEDNNTDTQKDNDMTVVIIIVAMVAVSVLGVGVTIALKRKK